MVLWYTDVDRDDVVTKSELKTLEITANKWATTVSKVKEPTTIKELCDAVFRGFNREELRRNFEIKSGSKDELKTITEALKVWEGGSRH